MTSEMGRFAGGPARCGVQPDMQLWADTATLGRVPAPRECYHGGLASLAWDAS